MKNPSTDQLQVNDNESTAAPMVPKESPKRTTGNIRAPITIKSSGLVVDRYGLYHHVLNDDISEEVDVSNDRLIDDIDDNRDDHVKEFMLLISRTVVREKRSRTIPILAKWHLRPKSGITSESEIRFLLA